MKVMVVVLRGPSKALLMTATASEWDSLYRLLELTCSICWPNFRPTPDRAAEPSGYRAVDNQMIRHTENSLIVSIFVQCIYTRIQY